MLNLYCPTCLSPRPSPATCRTACRPQSRCTGYTGRTSGSQAYLNITTLHCIDQNFSKIGLFFYVFQRMINNEFCKVCNTNSSGATLYTPLQNLTGQRREHATNYNLYLRPRGHPAASPPGCSTCPADRPGTKGRRQNIISMRLNLTQNKNI